MRKRFAIASAGVASVLGAIAALGLPLGDRTLPGAGTGGHADVRLRASPFRIGGDAVEPLSPGRSAPVDVTITNPRNTPLTVTRLRVRVRAVTAPRADAAHPCSRRDFGTRQVPKGFTVTVPARGSRSLSDLDVPRTSWPKVRMVNRPVNQDGCKGARLTLRYVGSGRLRR